MMWRKVKEPELLSRLRKLFIELEQLYVDCLEISFTGDIHRALAVEDEVTYFGYEVDEVYNIVADLTVGRQVESPYMSGIVWYRLCKVHGLNRNTDSDCYVFNVKRTVKTRTVFYYEELAWFIVDEPVKLSVRKVYADGNLTATQKETVEVSPRKDLVKKCRSIFDEFGNLSNRVFRCRVTIQRQRYSGSSSSSRDTKP